MFPEELLGAGGSACILVSADLNSQDVTADEHKEETKVSVSGRARRRYSLDIHLALNSSHVAGMD